MRVRFGCGYTFVVLALVAFGSVAYLAGHALAPATGDAARIFASDPSCSADLSHAAARGACTIENATVATTEMRTGGPSKSSAKTPYAYLQFADGTRATVELDGSDGDSFAASVRSGAAARVQKFGGTIVRIVAGADATETVDAPDVNAETVGEMTFVGPGAIVFGVLVAILRWLYVRRFPPQPGARPAP